MRIHCPFCGERDSGEFTVGGDASCARPNADLPDALDRFVDSTYFRDNPAGLHEELWYHGFGCRGWLRVRRDTRTHEVLAVEFTRDGAGG